MAACPVCESPNAREFTGEYDSEGKKLTPDEISCDDCGFFYQEHVKHPLGEAVARHRKRLEAEGVTP